MGRKNKKNVDRAESLDTSPMRSTNVERDDRQMSAGSHGDHSAGNEGIDDPAISRSHRDDMDEIEPAGTATRLTTGSSGMDASDAAEVDESQGEDMSRSSKQHSTRGTGNPRQQGRESTDSNSQGFGGKGAQKEGGPNREGTGYTNDSKTDESDV